MDATAGDLDLPTGTRALRGLRCPRLSLRPSRGNIPSTLPSLAGGGVRQRDTTTGKVARCVVGGVSGMVSRFIIWGVSGMLARGIAEEGALPDCRALRSLSPLLKQRWTAPWSLGGVTEHED